MSNSPKEYVVPDPVPKNPLSEMPISQHNEPSLSGLPEALIQAAVWRHQQHCIAPGELQSLEANAKSKVAREQ